jgi:hypothetical protein
MEGRIGMVVVELDEHFDWDTFAQEVHAKLHLPARPVFVRVTKRQGGVTASGLFKLQKVQLAKEAMDPSKVGSDEVYWLRQGRYVRFGPADWTSLQQAKARL